MGIIVILQRIMVVGFEHLTRKQQLDTFDNCIGDNSETTSDQGSLRHIGILYIYISCPNELGRADVTFHNGTLYGGSLSTGLEKLTVSTSH